MSDAEFSALKEELLWNGSKVAVLDRDELTFLEASMVRVRAGQFTSTGGRSTAPQDLNQPGGSSPRGRGGAGSASRARPTQCAA